MPIQVGRGDMDTVICHNAVPLQELALARSFRILVLAPHPDDFDTIGATMRFFQAKGNPLHLVVATSGASGVEDGFCSPPTRAVKAALREEEQRASCRFFGLPEGHMTFLRLAEDEAGDPLPDEANAELVRQQLLDLQPTLVFLPHSHDTNPGHRRLGALFRRLAQELAFPTVAFFNRDPKTMGMRCDVYHAFGDAETAWKGKLLRFHRSQQQRNLNQRGSGFDERILRLDRENAVLCGTGKPYAEVFELEFFGPLESRPFDFVSGKRGGVL